MEGDMYDSVKNSVDCMLCLPYCCGDDGEVS